MDEQQLTDISALADYMAEYDSTEWKVGGAHIPTTDIIRALVAEVRRLQSREREAPTHQYSLAITTGATREAIEQDFAVLKSLNDARDA